MKNKNVIQRLVAVSFAIMLMLPMGAFADNVVNDVATNPGSNTLTVGGSTSVDYKIVANNGDGQTGCNAADSSPATVTIYTPSGSGVIPTPGSLTFTTCGVFKPVTFTATTAGDYVITVSVSDSGPGSYNIVPATFTLHVLAPLDTTPPVITIIGDNPATVEAGSTYIDAGATANDAVDGPVPVTTVANMVDTGVVGTYSVSYSATDSHDNTATAQRTVYVVDTTAPVVVATPDRTSDYNGWYNNPVTITFSGTDISSISCDPSVTYSGPDGNSLLVTGSCTDASGNTGTGTFSFKYDATLPIISGSALPAPNTNGWNKEDVTVTFTCGDVTSGIESCTFPQTLSSEGAGQSVTGTAKDNAGNSNSATVDNINTDKTVPTVGVTGFSDGAVFHTGDILPIVGCSQEDTLSGIDSSSGPAISGGLNINGVGSVTYQCIATDKAGNIGSDTRTYSVLYSGLSGILQPINPDGTSLFNRGRSVPVKFQLAGDPYSGFNTEGWKVQGISVACAGSSIGTDLESVSSTTPSTTFRYDAFVDQYIYNADFRNQPTGSCWKVKATLDDGQSMMSAVFKLAK